MTDADGMPIYSSPLANTLALNFALDDAIWSVPETARDVLTQLLNKTKRSAEIGMAQVHNLQGHKTTVQKSKMTSVHPSQKASQS